MLGGFSREIPPPLLGSRHQSLFRQFFCVNHVVFVDGFELGSPVGEALAEEVVELGGVGQVDFFVVNR